METREGEEEPRSGVATNKQTLVYEKTFCVLTLLDSKGTLICSSVLRSRVPYQRFC
jgi:hypothetical protein